ncbi:uncharacterized protein K460DRAFT_406651 [Cucurbitaria berberidis CBS 394.84]|uniref:Uncharacterized protein n=1 Tax=Cucurbitaria berberidis CBS 394.84 TaxID=1168544 RepID=A0A9P4GHV4_9PLEO|nr:uncharacterized protein K460DRAFT_406651 [Cucurbitaria berberidis CBS 394.84]KAF1846448.1 hypothetical protein K460DRAFT_406651 [Cucurbitaria berberidis CBS 394.84]
MAPVISIPPRSPIERIRNLKLSEFYCERPTDEVAGDSHQGQTDSAESEKTAWQLRKSRDRFAMKIPIGGNDICFLVDRAAVLDIYAQAIATVGPKNHKQINFEATLKIKTILGIRQAEPHDVVFASGGMFLTPLEPQYAEPRIEFGDDEGGV